MNYNANGNYNNDFFLSCYIKIHWSTWDFGWLFNTFICLERQTVLLRPTTMKICFLFIKDKGLRMLQKDVFMEDIALAI